MSGSTEMPRASAVRPIEERLAAAGLPSLARQSWVEVDVGALEDNARALRRQIGPGTTLGVVVKADGYGHGIEMAARAAVAGGAGMLVVATLDEALVLRAAGFDTRILVLYAIPPDRLVEAAELAIELSTPDPAATRPLLREWAEARRRRAGLALRVHLEIDTGMTRGGALPGDAAAVAGLLADAEGIELSGVWTHLAASGDAEVSLAQARAFEAARGAIEATGIRVPEHHIAASGGLLGGIVPTFDLVRIGIAFYGEPPEGEGPAGAAALDAAGLRPALTLKARPVRLEWVEPGTPAGYGGEWRAERRSRIATLALGYADGWARGSWPGLPALVQGRRVPLAGRVSMDGVMYDVTDVDGVTADDEFVLIGEQAGARITATEVGAFRRTNNYEVLAALGPRLARVYRQGDRIVALRSLSQGLVAAKD
jgi:alanine racemase